MAWSRRKIVQKAFGELALAGYEWDMSPEEEGDAVDRFDALMAEWLALGINLGQTFSADPDEDTLDNDSGLPMIAVSAAYLALAVRLAASKGKQLLQSTVQEASRSYAALLSFVAHRDVQQQQLSDRLPRGAGAKPWRTNMRPFMSTPNTGPIRGTDDGGLALGRSDP